MSFPCASGRVEGSILIDANGRFDVAGTYAPMHGRAPSDDVSRPAAEAVRYEGRVSGEELALSVHHTDPNMPAEHFALTRGAPAHVPDCGGAA